MNTSSFSAQADNLIIPGVRNALRIATSWFKSFGLIGAIVGFLVVDLITGPWYLNGTNPNNSLSYTTLFWALSFALSGLQLVLWSLARSIFRKETFVRWWSALPVMVALVLIGVDTLLDIGWVTQWVYPEAPSFMIFAEGPWDYQKFFWLVGVFGFGGVSLFSELALMWMLSDPRERQTTSSPTLYDSAAHPDEIDPSGKIAGEPLLSQE